MMERGERKLTESLDHKVQILHSNIARLQQQAAAAGATPQTISTLCAPYLDLLKEVYTEEYPLARAIEDSDLLLHLEGPAASVPNPSVALIAEAFKKVRTQVASVAKAIAQMSPTSRMIPREVDLGLAAIARGSLYLGFTLPTGTGLREKEAGQVNLLGEDDLLYQAARQAIKTIGIVTEHVAQNPTAQGFDELEEMVPDAQVRDVALTAITKLAPVGKGVTKVGISGKGTNPSDSILTPAVRKELRRHLADPVKKDDQERPSSFTGKIREIDLDAQRFELRNLEGESVSMLRCSYTNKSDKEVRGWLGRRVKVTGFAARDKEGRPRLLAVERVEDLDAPSIHQMSLL
jgi:hypothetical protein